jgi:uncharacterized membrane protein YcjF (UPF0283 family)
MLQVLCINDLLVAMEVYLSSLGPASSPTKFTTFHSAVSTNDMTRHSKQTRSQASAFMLASIASGISDLDLIYLLSHSGQKLFKHYYEECLLVLNSIQKVKRAACSSIVINQHYQHAESKQEDDSRSTHIPHSQQGLELWFEQLNSASNALHVCHMRLHAVLTFFSAMLL